MSSGETSPAKGGSGKGSQRKGTSCYSEKRASRGKPFIFVTLKLLKLPRKREKKETDCDYNPEPVVKVKQQNTHSLEHTCSAADRVNIGNRGASHLCNSYAKDMGWLTSENRLMHTLDPSKLSKQRRREREKIKAKEEKEISSRSVQSVYFDGKKIATMVRHTSKNGKVFQKMEIQDHYVLIEEPQSVFLGHVVPFSGHGISLAVAIHRYLKKRSWDKDAKVFGCDGTNPNIGRFQGCLPYLEKLLGHAVHWEVCLLHGNELPLRALFTFYDGKTSGPASFTGPIGKQLQEDLTQRKPVKFAKIRNNSFPQIPEEVVCDLIHDHDHAGPSLRESWMRISPFVSLVHCATPDG